MGIKTKNTTKKNWALPGEPITESEFKAGIKDAEAGPFYSIDESKEIIEEWRKQKKSR